MDILALEDSRIEVLRKLNEFTSSRQRFALLFNFVHSLLALQDHLIRDSYLAEFLPLYFSELGKFSPEGIPLSFSRRVAELNKHLTDTEDTPLPDIHSAVISTFDKKITTIENSLEGKTIAAEEVIKSSFVLLETLPFQEMTTGALESFTIHLSYAKNENHFTVVPSAVHPDELLEQQIRLCFQKALALFTTYSGKRARHYDIILSFDNKHGNYTGESFGSSLTVVFLAELFHLHNTPIQLRWQNNVICTGAIDEHGNIKPVSQEIITKKTEAVFYSHAAIFVVPEADENSAKIKLEELKQEYPKRSLKIVGIENIQDLLNRRDIVDIRKQNPVKRAGMGLRRHWKAAIFVFLLSVFFSFLFSKDWDGNPAILTNEGGWLMVKNKSGKLLWRKKSIFLVELLYVNPFRLLVDINNDGINEVIISEEELGGSNNQNEKSRIICYDSKGQMIWKYLFKDSVRTRNEILTTHYSIALLANYLDADKNSILLCSTNNIESFSSAIFKLDIHTGKRLPGTLWHAGHINNLLIESGINNSQKKLFFAFINNSYERSGFGIISPDSLEGMCPAEPEYRLEGKLQAKLISYILIPSSDYNHYFKRRNNTIHQNNFHFEPEIFALSFATMEYNKEDGIIYRFDLNSLAPKVFISSGFRVSRDTLVAQGKLQPPYTDTKEYCDMIAKQILIWNGIDKFQYLVK